MVSNLLAEMKKDGYRGERKAATRGGEWQGPCVFCRPPGTDRLRVQPNHGDYGYFECRKCEKKGSLIDYLQAKRGYTQNQALKEVGWKKTKGETKPPSAIPDNMYKGEAQTNHVAPCQAWQTSAKAFVVHCENILWDAQGKDALEYLHGRGLKDETIRDARLGYNPAEMKRQGERWGLKGKIILRQGIIIPWFINDDIWRVSIRDEKATDPRHRYKQVAGGSNGLYRASYLRDKVAYRMSYPDYKVYTVLVEGEIDALSVAQECSQDVIACATGSTDGSRTDRWLSMIGHSDLVLVAFDADSEGDKAAYWWVDFFYRSKIGHRLRPVWNDANQMLQNGIDLRNEWVLPKIESILHGSSSVSNPVQEPFECGSLLCVTCLDLDKETPATYEGADECMYCAEHFHDQAPSPSPEPQPDPDPQPELPYLTTVVQVQDLAAQLQGGTYVLDLETTGLNPRKNKVITIALGTVSKVWVIDTRGFYATSDEGKAEWKEALQILLHRDDITWVVHNGKFDWSFLAVQFDVRLRKMYDTMLIEKLLHNGERVSASLQSTAARYGLEVSKEERNWFIDLDQRLDAWGAFLPPEQLAYIEQDIKVPCQVLGMQQEPIAQAGLSRVVTLENNALPTIAAMEVHGITVDVERWKGILELQRARQDALTAHLKQVLGDALADQEESQQDGKLFSVRPERPHVNLGSSDQLMKALQALGVVVFGTSKEVLEEMRDVHEIIPHLLEWKKLEKFISAFGNSLLKHVQGDGRIHATFDQMGADSGRITCREPNLQQIPKPQDDDTNIRSCFVAPPDHKLLVADLSNIELRILAEASGDPTMLRFFAEGKDLHSETAKLMFNLPPETDTKKHLINGVKARDIAKTINFGLAYGMGPSGLANRVGVDLETAKQLMNTYFATYKGVDGYLKRTGRKGAKEGYAVTLAGRRRTFAQEDLSNPAKRGRVERAAKNHPVQGTNADILKRALALLFERLPGDVHVVLTVHDEIVLETPTEKLDIAENILKETMMDACRDFLKKVAIPEPDVLIAGYWVKG